MRKLIFFLVLLGIMSIVTGCGKNIQVQQQNELKKLEAVHINKQNFQYGVKQASYVGQPLIKKRDFWVIASYDDQLVVTEDMSYKYGRSIYEIKAGTIYKVIGQIETSLSDDDSGKSEEFLIIDMRRGDSANPQLALVRTNGQLVSNILVAGHNPRKVVKVKHHSSIEFDSDIRLKKYIVYSIDKSQPMYDYELIYGGTEKDSFVITLREYGFNDINNKYEQIPLSEITEANKVIFSSESRTPSYYQNFVYETNDTRIRYKNFSIQVHQVDNEKITYTVLREE